MMTKRISAPSDYYSENKSCNSSHPRPMSKASASDEDEKGARAELSRYGIISFYDDKYNCAQLGYSRQMQPQNYGIKNKSLNDIIYPNPVDNILYIFSNESISDVEFTIFDAVGRQVYKSKVSFINGKTELDISSLAPGIYSIVSTDPFTFGFRSKFTVVR